MNCETLDHGCKHGILVLVLGILVFGPLAMGAVDAWAFLVIQGLTIGVMLERTTFWKCSAWPAICAVDCSIL